ncbi:MAG: sugar ABC transporter ATP-binding protein [Chloroflexi bacterium]|nr:sugar ABC transporter ATP-binding protein [Chloroflexota bacterium]
MSGPVAILEMRGISKSFPGVKALNDVTFECRPGGVHALVGENGAGKSTLMKILSGVYQPDAGEVFWRGQRVRLQSPRDAQDRGISIIYQEFNLVPYMNVAENILLGREPSALLGMLDRRKLYSEARRWLDILNVDLNPRLPIERLTVAQQQIVEIVKALTYDAELIVMDEPTAALAPHEVSNLFRFVETLKSRGKTVIFISHRLDEVFQVADWITVLKDGSVVASRSARDLNKAQVVQYMVGRELKETFPTRSELSQGPAVLEMMSVSSNGRLRDVSLTLRRGEVVGVAGLEGHGQRELARILFGLEPISAGEIRIGGKPVRLDNPRGAMSAGVAFVSDDRKGEGLQLLLSVRRNISLPSLGQLCNLIFVRLGKERTLTEQVAQKVDIRASSLDVEVATLSGGNQQKTILAKWLTREPTLMVFDEPTRGIDVGAKVEIYRLMRALAADGKAVIMVSSDLLEVIGMSDRIIVMHNGSIAAEMRGDVATEEEIMRAATGYSQQDEAEISAGEKAAANRPRLSAAPAGETQNLASD